MLNKRKKYKKNEGKIVLTLISPCFIECRISEKDNQLRTIHNE